MARKITLNNNNTVIIIFGDLQEIHIIIQELTSDIKSPYQKNLIF